MDNDNEINNKDVENLAHREVQILLKNELKNLEFNKTSAYDLNSEYAKTRKNHNFGIWAMLVACFFVVGFSAFTVSRYVTNTDKNIKIDIDTFDDLNLRSLLNMVGRTEGLYGNATKRRAELQASLDYELKQASEKRDNDLFTLKSLSLRDKNVVAKRTSAIQREYKDSVASLHGKYDVDIQTAENEINQYQKELSTYDSSKVAYAQEQEAAIDSQRQLHDIEMQRQSEKYESETTDLRGRLSEQQKESVTRQRAAVSEVTKRYQAEIALLDPVVSDIRGNNIVSSIKTASVPNSYDASSYAAAVLPGETLASAFSRVQSIYSDFDYTSKIVSSVPQYHSIPSYVSAMKSLAYQVGNEVSAAAARESSGLQKKNAAQKQRLDVQSSYFDYLLSQEREKCDGLILSDSNKTSMPVYVSESSVSSSVGADACTAYVRQGKSLVELNLKKHNGVFYASCADDKLSGTVRTGDKFYIKAPDSVVAPQPAAQN